MDEEKEEKPTTENTGEGNKSEASTLIDDANLASKRLEDATKAAREERLAREESYSKMKLGGDSEAGVEEKKIQYTEEQLASRKRIKAIGDASGAGWAKNYE